MVIDVSDTKVSESVRRISDDFHRNPPEWAKDGGIDGYWGDVVDWARMCHTGDDDEQDDGRSERSDL